MNGGIGITLTEEDKPDLDKIITLSPDDYNCETGVQITIEDTQVGVTYELMLLRDGFTFPLSLDPQVTIEGDGTDQTFDYTIFANSHYIIYAKTEKCEGFLDTGTLLNFDIPGALTPYQVTGHNVCLGDAGAYILLSGSQLDRTYYLNRVGEDDPIDTFVGTGNPIYIYADNYPLRPGIYTILGVSDGYDCELEMDGEFELKYHPMPVALELIGTGAWCEGEDGAYISLENSEENVLYILEKFYTDENIWFEFDRVNGNGATVTFKPIDEEGRYRAFARNIITNCTSNMNGEIEVFTTTAPNIDGIGIMYNEVNCSVIVGLYPTETGMTYTLIDNDGNIVESIVADDTEGISFNINENGIYTIDVSNDGSCTVTIPYDIVVDLDEIPTKPVITGPDSECSTHFEIVMQTSQIGVMYQLVSDEGDYDTPIMGDGNEIIWDISDWKAGVSYFWVVATNDAGCTIDSETIIVNILLAVQEFTLIFPEGNSYCANEDGVLVAIDDTEIGVLYRLFDSNDNQIDLKEGNGGTINFIRITAGTYYVVGVNSATPQCFHETDPFEIIANDAPETPVITIPTADCLADFDIIMSISHVGVEYQLYSDEGAYETPIEGTGDEIIWEITDWKQGISYFWVVATNVTTGCTATSATITVNIDDAVQPFTYLLPDGVAYCTNEAGVRIGVEDTETGVMYRLYDVNDNYLAIFEGSGDTQFFPQPYYTAGTYYITGTSAQCTYRTDNFEIVVLDIPETPVITIPTSDCVADFDIIMSISHVGIDYQLFSDEGIFGTAIEGTGDPIIWEITDWKQGISHFWVVATNADDCSVSSETVTVNIDDAVQPFEEYLPEGHSYCANVGGVRIGVQNSANGILYSLYDSNDVEIAMFRGNGNTQFFPNTYPADTYYIEGAAANCTFRTEPFTITWFPAPEVFNISSGGLINEHEITLSGSEIGMVYELYRNAVNFVSRLGGTGDPLNFGTQPTAGYYTIKAINNTTNCEVWMNGTAILYETEVEVDFDGLFYCANEAEGVHIMLYYTELDLYYRLYSIVGTTEILEEILLGDGFAQTFSRRYYGEGFYLVRKYYSELEWVDSEIFEIVSREVPIQYEMTLSTGIIVATEILLSEADGGINYYLYRNDIDIAPAFEDEKYIDEPFICEENCIDFSFGTVNDFGYYYVWAQAPSGCKALMSGRTHIIASELIAVNDTIHIAPDQTSIQFDIFKNDIWWDVVDTLGVNLEFEYLIVEPDYKRAIGQVHISNMGILSYDKLPGFFGYDSLTYRVTNTLLPGRYSEAKVRIVAGNEIFDQFSFILPNAFSPNGDGLNDTYVISGLDQDTRSRLEVYNKWGTLVYRSPGVRYGTDSDWWDGKANVRSMVSIGNELPNGVYYYILKVEKNIDTNVISKEFNGFIELRR